MILESKELVPYYGCKAASIKPADRNRFLGTLSSTEGDLDVSITREEDEGGVLRFVMASVRLVRKAECDIDEYATEIARRALFGGPFERVTVDLRDGETAYWRDWAHHFPDDEEMDRFLEEARAFAESHLDEIRGMAQAGASEEHDSELEADLLNAFEG